MKLYEVIFQDEYNNLYHLGYYKTLAEATKEVNKELAEYHVQLKEDDLKEYPNTFNMCFDACVADLIEDEKVLEENEELYNMFIRGFILDSDYILEVINSGN